MLPSVENPLPETIGVGTIFSVAGACGTFALFLATMLNYPAPQRDAWHRVGTSSGFVLGTIIYFTALLIQLFCRQ